MLTIGSVDRSLDRTGVAFTLLPGPGSVVHVKLPVPGLYNARNGAAAIAAAQ